MFYPLTSVIAYDGNFTVTANGDWVVYVGEVVFPDVISKKPPRVKLTTAHSTGGLALFKRTSRVVPTVSNTEVGITHLSRHEVAQTHTSQIVIV